MLFFPLVNFDNDNVCTGGPAQTVDQLRAFGTQVIDGVTELHASVDGVPLKNLFGYRVTSPVFSYTLPPNNIYDDPRWGCVGGWPPGVQYPAVSDGYWLMLAPLSAGSHTINFGGSASVPISTVQEVTYHLTVTS
jgi:hypothetical protein